MPVLQVQIGVGINTSDGFVSMADTHDVTEEIAAIRKEMHGDASDAERYLQLSRLYDKSEGNEQAGKEALNKAIEYFRKRVEERPQDGHLLIGYGEALSRSEKP